MTTPRVSVLIPSRNAASRIQACLRTVLKQDFENIEIVLVDDSTDETVARARDVLAPTGRPFRIIDGGRCGVSHARNLALTHATGDYVQWLDADDELPVPSKIRMQVEALRDQGPNAVAVTDFAWMDVETRPPSFRPVPTALSDDPLLVFLLGRVPQPGAFLFPRPFAEKLRARGVFTEGVSFAEDREYATVAAMLGAKFIHVPLIGVVYFRWSATHQISRIGDASNHLAAFQGVFERLRRQAVDLGVPLNDDHRRLLEQDWATHRWAIRDLVVEPWWQPRAILDDGRAIDLGTMEAAIVQRRGVVEMPAALESVAQAMCETGAVFRYDTLAVRKALDGLVEKGALVRVAPGNVTSGSDRQPR